MLSAFWLLSTLPIILLVTLLSPTTSPHTFLPPYNPLIIPPNDPARILLLTSHPDDECLFFAPTLLALLRQGACPQGVNASEFRKNEVHSLCLSTGNAHGLGAVRAEELERSLDILGVDKDKRRVLNTTNLQDSMAFHWDPQTIAEAVRPYIIEHDITTILTFDHRGISQHPNHVSLPRGIAHFLASSYPSSSSTSLHAQPRPRLYTLITLSLLPKYTSLLAAVLAKFDLQMYRMLDVLLRWVSRVLGADVERAGTTERIGRDVNLHVFVSGVREYGTALRAMRAHGSQTKWYRWLYVAFSRYMWVNEWVEVEVDRLGDVK